MKRHDALQPLSRDHHNVLVHARRLRGLDARVDPATARRRFLAYFDAVLRHHFDEEEAVLVPLVREAALRQRLVAEHADLVQRSLALVSDPSGQGDLGELLRQHVRFEEDALFPHLEQTVADVGWPTIVEGRAKIRQARRPGSLAGDEACFL